MCTTLIGFRENLYEHASSSDFWQAHLTFEVVYSNS